MAEGNLIAPNYLKISLPRYPRLAPWIKVIDLGDNRLQLRGAEHAFTIQHPLFINIFQFLQPHLSGSHSQATLIKKTKGKFLPDTVLFVLKLLRANGVLQEGITQNSKPFTKKSLAQLEPKIQFLSHFTENPIQALSQIQNANILIFGSKFFSKIIKDSFSSAGFNNLKALDSRSGKTTIKLESLEKSLTPKKEPWDLVIACQEGLATPFFTQLNTFSQKNGFRWISLAVSGTTGLLGPTIIPGQSACYTCIQTRITANSQDPNSHKRYQDFLKSELTTGDEGVMPPLLSLLADQATLEAIRLITGLMPAQTINRLFEFKISTPIPKGHQVFRVPRCPDCHPSFSRQAVWDYQTLSTQ